MREALRRGRTMAVTAVATVSAAALLLTGCGAGPTPGGNSRQGDGGKNTHRPAPRPTPVWDWHPTSIAALGDSITRGFDACSLLSDCPDVSWATGTRPDVDSVTRRLLPQQDGHSWNFAKTGARMADLADQMSDATAHKPRLVTVLMGANDACTDTAGDMTSVADYREQFTTAMDALHTASPGTEVYVASIPDLRRLWSVGRNNPLGSSIWKLGICQSILANANSTDPAVQARRDAVRARVVAFNDTLREVCGHYPLCRFDGGVVFDYAFKADELSSWDWFHPNTVGQAQLARMAYEGVTRH